MKKFLGILLAVMMVFSTVSFAAPVAAGADTTIAAEETAELAAFEPFVNVLMAEVNFDTLSTYNANGGSNWPELASIGGAWYSDAVSGSMFGNISGFRNVAEGPDGTEAISGTGTGYKNFTLYNNSGPYGAWTAIQGYVVEFDAKFSAAPNNAMVRFCVDSGSTYVQKDYAAKSIGNWDHYTVDVSAEEIEALGKGGMGLLQMFTNMNGAADTVAYDNIKLYAKVPNKWADAKYGDVAMYLDFNSIETASVLGSNGWPHYSALGGELGEHSSEGVGLFVAMTASQGGVVDTMTGKDGTPAFTVKNVGSGWKWWVPYNNSGPYNQLVDPGQVITLVFDAYYSETPGAAMVRFCGSSGGVYVQKNFMPTAGWGTYEVSVTPEELEAVMGGRGPGSFEMYTNFNNGGQQYAFDNFKVCVKPATTTVDINLMGETVATKENVSTLGVTVKSLLDGISVEGYELLGVEYGGTIYSLADNGTVVFPTAEEAVELVFSVCPTTHETTELRASGETSGIRFSAEIAPDDNLAQVGWIVASAKSSTFSFVDRDAMFKHATAGDKGVNYVEGINKDASAAKFEEVDGMEIFKAVLTNIPVSAYNMTFYARPFCRYGVDEYYYGAVKTTKLSTVAKALKNSADEYAALTDAQKAVVDAIVAGVEF